jgi:dipeptidyl aminopeptidase/acylaminoacyl peptidase
MRKRLSFLGLVFCLLVAADTVLAEDMPAPPSLDRLLNSLSTVQHYSDVRLSPDGQAVAWVESVRGGGRNRSRGTAIHVASLPAPGTPNLVSAGDGGRAHSQHGIAWCPDSTQLAFLSDREKPGQLQLYVAPAGGGAARKLTNLTGFLADPQWSPDGKTVAVLFTENAPRSAGPLGPGAVETGVIEEHIYEQRLTLVEVNSGRVRQLSPPDLYVYEYDWSPDGKTLAAIAAHGSGDNNWYIAQLYTFDVQSGEARSIFKPTLQIAIPRWSPDGKSVAFIGGLMSDEGAIGGEIYTVPAAGGPARNLTPDLPTSARALTWLPSGLIVFEEHVDGGSGMSTLDPAAGQIRPLWRAGEATSVLSLSRDGKTSALVRQSFEQPPEIWAGAIGDWKRLTTANEQQRPGWGKPESVHWDSDGWKVQGWLVYPRDYRPERRYPMVVSIHGGPAWLRTPNWPGTGFDLALLSSQGYFVFFPNPRGSYGHGEKFTRANVKDFGYGDLRDILRGVDQVVKTRPVDGQRLGLGGWSYGGYMTMWAVTQTHRFRTAVAGAGIANWQSYYGENGIDQWMIPYFGASVYDDPAVYARSSPITFIKQVKTPTLILVGERDIECPVPQSFEFWHALKTFGVPTQFVVYAGEGHGIGKPEHRRDILRRTVAWYDRYLKGPQKGMIE